MKLLVLALHIKIIITFVQRNKRAQKDRAVNQIQTNIAYNYETS